MEDFEEKWVKAYTARIAAMDGDLAVLTKDERKHLTLLMRKFNIEQESVEIDTELSQAKLL